MYSFSLIGNAIASKCDKPIIVFTYNRLGNDFFLNYQVRKVHMYRTSFTVLTYKINDTTQIRIITELWE